MIKKKQQQYFHYVNLNTLLKKTHIQTHTYNNSFMRFKAFGWSLCVLLLISYWMLLIWIHKDNATKALHKMMGIRCKLLAPWCSCMIFPVLKTQHNFRPKQCAQSERCSLALQNLSAPDFSAANNKLASYSDHNSDPNSFTKSQKNNLKHLYGPSWSEVLSIVAIYKVIQNRTL